MRGRGVTAAVAAWAADSKRVARNRKRSAEALAVRKYAEVYCADVCGAAALASRVKVSYTSRLRPHTLAA